MIDFAHRIFVPENMDDADCDETQLIRTVKQFRLINRLFSNASAILNRFVLSQAPSQFSIMDVGAGGCDIMQWLVKVCRKKNLDVTVTCLDSDPRIVAYAETACASYPEITVVQGNLLDLNPSQGFDYVFANHLLHHFPDDGVSEALRTLYRLAKRRLIVSDLRRSRAAHTLFGIYAWILCRNSFARYDGMLSIRKGFSMSELKYFAAKAGLERANIHNCIPARWLLIAEAHSEYSTTPAIDSDPIELQEKRKCCNTPVAM